jgi:Hemerythrin HHE cation binding domain
MPDKQDAIALLKADHRKVEGLFEKFQKAKDSSAKEKLAKEICTELSIHTMIEEEIFYPACTGKIEDDTVHEAYVEHDGAKVMIAEILASSPDGDEFYDSKVHILSEEIKHHVHEEEARSEGMFAQAREAGLDMETLGSEMMSRKEELMDEFKSGNLPPPETRTFKGHKLRQGEPFSASMQ